MQSTENFTLQHPLVIDAEVQYLELPAKIIHWRHSIDHPLHLKFHPQQYDSTCEFCLNNIGQVIPKAATFACDACGEIGADSMSYFCKFCSFWIHKSCASLPLIIGTWSHHPHLVFLEYSALSSNRKFRNLLCNFCNQRIPPGEWAYRCGICVYFVHLKCLKKNCQLIKEESEGLILLPWTDMSTHDLIRKPFGFAITLPTPEDEIKEFSHEHRLTLSYYPMDDELQNGEEILCDGCIEPIFTIPYYNCTLCRYFLHISCAHFQETLQYIGQGDFLGKELEHPERHFVCNLCQRAGSGFFITDDIGLRCHLQCILLPFLVNHEAHQHPIARKFVSDMSDVKKCSACGEDCAPSFGTFSYLFVCITGRCPNFGLHPYCAVLPRTVRHRWDRHKLVLRYNSSFAADPSEEFYCEICEEQIKDEVWRYHCSECNQAFHLFCIPRLGKDRYIKFGGMVQVEEHQHPLRFVREGKYGSACSYTIARDCKGALAGERAYECQLCDFSLCHPCICLSKSK